MHFYSEDIRSGLNWKGIERFVARLILHLGWKEVPEIKSTNRKQKLILGGYSLAGLFALWSAYQTDLFSGIVAASPSVWYPDWMEYAQANQVKTSALYLSLGDREERTRNLIMSAVGDNIRKQCGSYGNPDKLVQNRRFHTDYPPDQRQQRGHYSAGRGRTVPAGTAAGRKHRDILSHDCKGESFGFPAQPAV